FDDGDEIDVPAGLIAVDTAPTRNDLKPGVRVVFGDGTIARLATVVKVNDDKVECRLEDLTDATAEVKDVRVVSSGTAAARTAKQDDVVWAQWRPNAWYHGKVTKKVDFGVHITFDDGDEADLPITAVAIDKAPAKDAVKPGVRVIAVWSDGKYYPGTVAGDGENGKYKIHFDDGDKGEGSLEGLRLLNE